MKNMKHMKDDEIKQLLAAACVRFDAMTPEQQAHERHKQRISYAVGEMILGTWERGETLTTLVREYFENLVRKVAGPCPCGCEP